MSETKALREEARDQARAIRAERKRVRKLPTEERRKARAQQKQARAERKTEVRSLEGTEKKRAKKLGRMVRRRVHPVRTALKGIACLLAIVLACGGVAVYMLVGSLVGRALTAALPVDTPEALTVQAASREAVVQVEEEAIVLLQNENGALPIAPGRVNLFGVGSTKSAFGGAGSGSADTSSATTLAAALSEAGFEVNPELNNLYTNWSNSRVISTEEAGEVDTSQARGIEQTTGTTFDAGELPAEGLTDELLSSARSFSDTAIIVITRSGSEGSDLTLDYLRLSDDESAMVDAVCDNFDHVIVLLNTANTMELGWIEEHPQIKSVLWIGLPGNSGMKAVAEVLAGTVNPSGRLVDTYAFDLLSNPANLMIADARWNGNEFTYDGVDNGFFINYYEDIYVGYRYYETRFEGDEDAYGAAVQYPFGYGLSYTSFDWEVEGPEVSGDTITARVRVTNTGEVSGRDVVQAYFNAPYVAGGIEKSSTELAAFAKTGELAPGDSEMVELSWNVRDMASWDDDQAAYVLDAGTYILRVARNVHDTVAQTEWQLDESRTFASDETTSMAYANQFEGTAGDITYLSRNDWDGTWPDLDSIDLAATEQVVADHHFQLGEPAEGVEAPAMGANNSLALADLRGLSYDDPQWDAFLDQLTFDEMARQVTGGGYGTEGIDRLGVPAKKDMDGPAAISNIWAGTSGVQFPAEINIAATWNTEMARLVGDRIAEEALVYGVVGWYAPGANLHRSAFGGRNFEYFSEDPLLSGKMAAAEIAAAENHGVVCYLKHFALNEQENNRNNNGLYTWAREQAIRELYLEPFEIAVKEGAPSGVMSSFARLGSVWAGGHRGLLTNVLRNEWGFRGCVVSDATNLVFWPYMDQAQGVLAGNDTFLDYGANWDAIVLKRQARNNPELQQAMRTACHNILYSVANSAAMES